MAEKGAHALVIPTGSLIVELKGGPYDGDTVILVPFGSVAPTGSFEYFGSDGESAGFHRYVFEGMESLAKWPDQDAKMVKVSFPYAGFRPLAPKGESDEPHDGGQG